MLCSVVLALHEGRSHGSWYSAVRESDVESGSKKKMILLPGFVSTIVGTVPCGLCTVVAHDELEISSYRHPYILYDHVYLIVLYCCPLPREIVG